MLTVYPVYLQPSYSITVERRVLDTEVVCTEGFRTTISKQIAKPVHIMFAKWFLCVMALVSNNYLSTVAHVVSAFTGSEYNVHCFDINCRRKITRRWWPITTTPTLLNEIIYSRYVIKQKGLYLSPTSGRSTAFSPQRQGITYGSNSGIQHNSLGDLLSILTNENWSPAMCQKCAKVQLPQKAYLDAQAIHYGQAGRVA